MTGKPFYAACLAGLVMLSNVAVAASAYGVIDLGTLPGDSESCAFGVNSGGDVVGVSSDPLTGRCRGFIWRNGTMTDLGTLGGAYTYAFAVNDGDQVVGWSRLSNGSLRAFLWQDGSMVDLGTLLGWSDANQSAALGISSCGRIVGNSNSAPGADNHAFVWADGVMTDLGTLPTGRDSGACAINDVGQVVGYSEAAGGNHACMWRDGSVIDLGPFPERPISWATDISECGRVVGTACASAGGNQVNHLGFSWYNGASVSIGALPGGSESGANGVNDLGQVVGWSTTADGSRHALLWQDGLMSDLGGLPGAGASNAIAINARGLVVGESGGHAVLWAPIPEPPSALALVVGVGGVLQAVLRRRR